MAHIDDYVAAQDPRVIAQVTAAIHAFAEQSYAANNSRDNPKSQLAMRITTGLTSLQPLVLSACSFGSLNAASTDTSVNNAIATLWPMWANA